MVLVVVVVVPVVSSRSGYCLDGHGGGYSGSCSGGGRIAGGSVGCHGGDGVSTDPFV